MPQQFSVAIVGAGPLGIELAIALKKAEIDYIQFDKEQAGQMVFNFPPQTRFFSSSDRIALAGMPIQTVDQQKCLREEYLAYLRALILHHRLEINTYEKVIAIQPLAAPNGFILKTKTISGEKQYQARYLVLATGGTSRPRLLNVPGEDLPHVATKMGDPHIYFQRRVLIIGARNSAVETALRCFHAGAKVSLALRLQELSSQEVKYWLLPELLGLAKRNEIACFYGVETQEILADRVIMRKKDSGEKVEIPADFVIKAIGFDADMELFKLLNIPLSEEQHHPHFDENTMETPVPGVFVLGTAVGGTQKKFRVFIENCHEHVYKITDTLCTRLGKKFPQSEFAARPQVQISSQGRLEE